MAPSAVHDEPLPQIDSLKSNLLKAQNAPFVYRNDTLKKPVADDYMYAFKYNFPLPTHGDEADILDFSESDETDKEALAHQFLQELQQVIQSRDAKTFANMFLDSGGSNIHT